jgi:arylsulfatase A-like enzyme/membrane protease YdiL (CAAX protease family)
MRALILGLGRFADGPRAAAATRLALASAVLTSIAMILVKTASISAVTATDLGRTQLDSEASFWNVAGWFAGDLWAALLWGLLMGLAFGVAVQRSTRIAAGMLLVVVNLLMAFALLSGLVVYQTFGTAPTLELLESIDQADNATASVKAMITGKLIGFGAVLAILLAMLPLALTRLMTRWPRVALGAAIFLGLASTVGVAGEIAGSPSRFELDRNSVLTFTRSMLVDAEAEAAVAYVPPTDYHRVLEPIAPPRKARVDRDAYTRLRELGEHRPNVVLVLMESTAIHYMSHTNPEIRSTPFMAELARKSLFWPHHYAHTPRSIFAIIQSLCSVLTPLHGSKPTIERPRIDCRSVSEVLGEAGYVGGMFHSGHFRMSRKDHFFAGRGWSVMHDAHSMPNAAEHYQWSWGIEEAATINAMVEWADKNREGQFFITYIPVYPHHPYHTPYPVESLADKRPERNADNYLKAARYVDDMMKKLVGDFEARGLAKDTLFVFTGDHGEGFGEHPGSFAHGAKLYDEQTRTFVLWYAPGLLDEQAVDERTFGHLDLVPTLVDILGLPREPRHRGMSALDPRRRAMVPLATPYRIPYVGFVDGTMKYIFNGRTKTSELYDLAADPGETVNLSSEFPETVALYQRRAAELDSVARDWWDSLPDLSKKPPAGASDGEEHELVLRTVDCEYSPKRFLAEDGMLKPLRSGGVRCQSELLPEGDIFVTGFKLIGSEALAAAVILGELAWINEDGQRRQLAYCRLNGNMKNPVTECPPVLAPAARRTVRDRGRFLSILRFRTPAKPPPFERFRVDEIRIRYRVLP